MDRALQSFNKYVDWLDDEFDDGLIIEYHNFDSKPTYKIMYDPSIDIEELKAAIPGEWRDLETAGEVRILIKEYTPDCEEHKRAEYIADMLLKDKRDELMKKLRDLQNE